MNNKRVIQISVDILINDNYNADDVISYMNIQLNKNTFKIVGIEFQHDLTEIYKEQYPDVLDF